MWKWLQTLFGKSVDEATLRDDVAGELRKRRRDGSDGAALLMVPGVAGGDASGSDTDASGGADGGAGAFDGGGCGASCGVA